MKTSRKIISEFLLELRNKLSSLKTLVLNFTNSNILELKISGSTEIKNENEFDSIKDNQFDLIIGDLPFVMNTIEINTISKLKVNKNWAYILWALRNLEMQGKAFFFIEPSILLSQQGKRFLQDLSKEKYFINSVFELPEKLLYPETAFQPIMVGFERTENQNIFIGEVTDDFNILLENYTKLQTSKNLSTGVIIERDKFTSFSQFRIETAINNLQTQYKDYARYFIKDIGVVNSTITTFEDKPNSIYIQKIGNSQVVSKIEQITFKHQYYFQVILKESIIKADFLVLFYDSELGKLILKSLKPDFTPNINKLSIENSYVAIPKLEEQNLLIDTKNKIIELQVIIDQLKSDLSLNPKNAPVILDKFESIQNPLKQLSDEDLILSLIRKGETKNIEFKATFSKGIKHGTPKFGQVDDEVKKSSLKTIVAFLNTNGGILLIGVADDKTVRGVEDDFYKSADDYKLNFKNAIRDKIGAEFYPFIEFELFLVNGKQVLKVDCQPSSTPCFLQDDFFVRVNPASEKLVGKTQADYIKNHFKYAQTKNILLPTLPSLQIIKKSDKLKIQTTKKGQHSIIYGADLFLNPRFFLNFFHHFRI